MRYYILLLMGIIFLGCYTERKAAEQVNKAIDQYPDTSAKITRSRFPCITKSLDSSSYLQTIKDLNEIIGGYDSALNAGGFENDKLRDLLIKYQSGEHDYGNCDSIYAELRKECSKANADNYKLKSTISQLRNSISNIKPVIKYIEDSAKIKIINSELNSAYDEIVKWKTLYEKEKEEHDKLIAKNKGKIRIPWWILLAIIASGFLAFKFRLIKL